MIYVLKNKFKLSGCHSSEELIAKEKLDFLDEPKELDKALSKFKNVYCWLSPYEAELNNKRFMYWSLDPDEAMEEYWAQNEEI